MLTLLLIWLYSLTGVITGWFVVRYMVVNAYDIISKDPQQYNGQYFDFVLVASILVTMFWPIYVLYKVYLIINKRKVEK